MLGFSNLEIKMGKYCYFCFKWMTGLIYEEVSLIWGIFLVNEVKISVLVYKEFVFKKVMNIMLITGYFILLF